MGGFIGEKKSEIDLILRKYIPKHSLRTRPFYPREDIEFPFVIKPDSGLRGLDVAFIQNKDELEKYLKESKKDLVEQEFCPYEHEIGVFYIRRPDEQRGRILSITKKEFPFVIGDGKTRLFDLVFSNKETKMRFEWLFEHSNLDPNKIPASGEKYYLTRKGSHSKGCLFKDGTELIEFTEPVARELDRIPDFHIGRVDVKYNDKLALKAGDFKIIELNGAGAESTNIYDPELTWLEVYRILYRQWKEVFEIGSINSRKRGRLFLGRFFFEIFIYKTNLRKRS